MVTVRGGRLAFRADAQPPVSVQHASDPLRGLIATGTSRADETVVIQVIAAPASRRRVKRLRTTGATGAHPASVPSMLLDLVDPTPHPRATSRQVSPYQRDVTKTASERARGLMFTVAIRYAVASPQTGKTAKNRLKNRAHTVAAALTAMCGHYGQRRARLIAPQRTIAQRYLHRGVLLTVDELATLAHLPYDEIVPALQRAGSRPVAPPASVIHGGRGTKILGKAAVTGQKIAITAADARHHIHIVGSTGVGKSTLLANLVLNDIAARRGVVVIDPKGDLVSDILDRLDPGGVTGRIVIIDPEQPNPPGLNPLHGSDPDLVTDHLVGICRRIFERHWGPRADDILRNALLTLLRIPGTTLEHLPSLLSKKEFRQPYIAGIDDPSGLGGFWEWYDSLTPGVQSQAAGPVLSRIRALLGREFVRKTLGAPSTGVNLRHVLDHGGILLARLPKGELGDDTARLVGSILVAKTWQAATGRTRVPETKRPDAAMYIDEAHNFLTLPRSLDEILAEARGYRVSLVLAHQHMAQLPREMQFAISANARTKLFFTASPEDARLLSRHTLPQLTEHDLSHLEAYTTACRTITNGREQPAFTLSTLPPRRCIGKARQVRANAAAATAKKDGE